MRPRRHARTAVFCCRDLKAGDDMTIVYVLLGGVAALWIWLHFLTKRFKADCIDGDSACPIREQRRIWNHIGWFSKSSAEKSYVREHAPVMYVVNRIAMLLVFVTVPLFMILLAGRLGG
jgi:hypothetical protein